MSSCYHFSRYDLTQWFNSIVNRMKKMPRRYLCLRMSSAIMILSKMKLHASRIWLEGYLLATYLILAQLRYIRFSSHNGILITNKVSLYLGFICFLNRCFDKLY